MKKIMILVLMVALGMLCLTGCGKKDEKEDPMPLAGVANPMVSYDSADAVEARCGMKLVIPSEATEAAYFIISNQIAECQFYVGDAKYSLRASKEDGDFTGVYDEYVYADMKLDIAGEAEGIGIFATGGCFAKWKQGDVRYSLVTLNSEVQLEDFSKAVYGCAGENK